MVGLGFGKRTMLADKIVQGTKNLSSPEKWRLAMNNLCLA